MKVYQQISGYKESVINLTVTAENTNSYFSVAVGNGFDSGAITGLHNTGFVVSGQNGYLFDQSGNFFAGYQPEIPFTISVHNTAGNRLMYYYNDKIISNNTYKSADVDYIEFDKNNASLLISVIGETAGNEGLMLSTGDILAFGGDFLYYS